MAVENIPLRHPPTFLKRIDLFLYVFLFMCEFKKNNNDNINRMY